MKIQKTYTRSKVMLFISLLILHTLSSCVHTGRQLDMNKCQYGKVEQGKEKIEINIQDPCIQGLIGALPYNQHKSKDKIKKAKLTPVGKKKKCLCGIAIGTLVTSALGILYFIGNPFSGPESMTNTTGASIGNGTTDQINNNGTIALPHNVYEIGLKQTDFLTLNNETNTIPKNATNEQTASSNGIIIQNLDIISDEIYEALYKEDFSQQFVEQLLIDDLSVNATRPDGSSLFSILFTNANSNVWKSVLEEGANINGQDSDGNTPLINAIRWKRDINEIIYLLDKGANPYIENKTKLNAVYYTNKKDFQRYIHSIYSENYAAFLRSFAAAKQRFSNTQLK